jgi:hypothetical protein
MPGVVGEHAGDSGLFPDSRDPIHDLTHLLGGVLLDPGCIPAECVEDADTGLVALDVFGEPGHLGHFGEPHRWVRGPSSSLFLL